jgi:hypothetical protein
MSTDDSTDKATTYGQFRGNKMKAKCEYKGERRENENKEEAPH